MKKYLIYKLANYLYNKITKNGSNSLKLGNLIVSLISSDRDERDIVFFTIEKE